MRCACYHKAILLAIRFQDSLMRGIGDEKLEDGWHISHNIGGEKLEDGWHISHNVIDGFADSAKQALKFREHFRRGLGS